MKPTSPAHCGFPFSESPASGSPSRSGLGGAFILAERLHNLTPEADAYTEAMADYQLYKTLATLTIK